MHTHTHHATTYVCTHAYRHTNHVLTPYIHIHIHSNTYHIHALAHTHAHTHTLHYWEKAEDRVGLTMTTEN